MLGRRQDARRAGYVKEYGISLAAPYRALTRGFMDQLDACADDSARRILLGKSEREGSNEDQRINPSLSHLVD